MDRSERVKALETLSQDLVRLHSRATDLLGDSSDPQERRLLSQLGDARRGLEGHLPQAQDALIGAEGRRDTVTGYLARKYGRRPTQR